MAVLGIGLTGVGRSGRHETLHQVVFFTEPVPGEFASRVVAAIVWRGNPPRGRSMSAAASTDRGTLDGSSAAATLPSGWNSRSDEVGPREALYSRARRLVRVAGREYPLGTDGRTLVLLVDDGGVLDAQVSVHTRELPLEPHEPLPETRWSMRALRSLFGRARRQSAAYEALMSDAIVHAFVATRSGEGAA